MAETRKFKPTEGDDLQKQVREAIGETVRPFEAGRQGQAKAIADDQSGPAAPSVTDLDASTGFLFYPPAE